MKDLETKWQTALVLLNTSAIIFLICFIYLHPRPKLAYVDSARLIASYKGMTKARAEYANKAKAWQSRIDTLTNDLHSAVQGYNQEATKLSLAEKQIRRADLERKKTQLEEYERAIRVKAQEADMNSTKLVLTEINKFLEGYGKEHGYSFILVANQVGSLAYADNTLDVTDSALLQLNETYSKALK